MGGSLMSWVISLITGGVGGNIAGALLKNMSLGPVGNTIAGIVGGGIGGQLLGSLLGGGGAAAAGAAATAGPSMLSNVAGSGIGGIVVMVIVGLIKNAMGNKTS
jgi:uncharacterized membrane protein YeaQ/YmgE (transglycosylase-associated protein family)